MSRAVPRSVWPFTVFTVALWAVVLPGILARQHGGGFALSWRHPFAIVVGGFLALLGAWLVHAAGRNLADRGVGVFGVVPGPALVTDGWYSRIRNPMDAGTTMIAVGVWAALAVDLVWVIPLAAVITFTVGSGMYEDRRLHEVFGDDFDEYKARVRKWVPSR